MLDITCESDFLLTATVSSVVPENIEYELITHGAVLFAEHRCYEEYFDSTDNPFHGYSPTDQWDDLYALLHVYLLDGTTLKEKGLALALREESGLCMMRFFHTHPFRIVYEKKLSVVQFANAEDALLQMGLVRTEEHTENVRELRFGSTICRIVTMYDKSELQIFARELGEIIDVLTRCGYTVAQAQITRLPCHAR